jgi:hypothetical protein
MEEQSENIFQKAEPPKRPQILSVLCILSFLGSSMSGFSFFMVYSAYDEVLPQLQEFAGKFPGMEYILSAPKGLFLTGFILYTFSFFGANLMWRLKKVGFHFYTAAQIALVLLPMIYIKGFPMPVIDGLVSALFIVLYFKHYKIFA